MSEKRPPCGCGRRAGLAVCQACADALTAAGAAKNDVVRENHALAAENVRLRGIVLSLAERIFVQSELLSRLAEKRSCLR